MSTAERHRWRLPREEPLRIANCSGFFGDRVTAARELLDSTDVHVLTGDWLAELTMAILAGQRHKDPTAGYARSFLAVVEQVLATCVERGIPIVANAGGLNPAGCARAVESIAAALGVPVKVGYVDGDDIAGRVEQLVATDALTDPHRGRLVGVDATTTVAANAYIGGWPIAACLRRGADVVVTGRVTDAALTIGPAAAAFAWAVDDWDQLAGSLVAGHVIECGTQATGGNYAHFQRDVGSMGHLAFPVAEIHPDGTSTITKAPGDGAVTAGTVTAQLLYEVGGPRYVNPDVTARLDTIRLTRDGPDRIRISGTRGEPPPRTLKVSIAVTGGYRNAVMLGVTGCDPVGKAEAAVSAIWGNIPRGRDAFEDVCVELIGRPTTDPSPAWGSSAAATCVLRVAVAGDDPDLVGRGFSSAVVATGLASYPGFFASGPPQAASAFTRYRPALVSADQITARAVVDGDVEELTPVGVAHGVDPTTDPGHDSGSPVVPDPDWTVAPLGRVAGARSGDKGGDANVGVWCDDDPTFAWLDSWLTSERLRALVPEAGDLVVRRYRFPALRALNFVIEGFLGEGVASCLRFDAQAKGLGEYLRSCAVPIPTALLAARSAALTMGGPR